MHGSHAGKMWWLDTCVLLTEVYHNVIEGKQDIDFVFQPPQTGLIDIIIKLPDAIAPSEVMNSSDSRVLGLGLLSMQLNQADIS